MSFVGLEPDLQWDISGCHLMRRRNDKDICDYDMGTILRITYLWRTRYALAVLQWAKVSGGTAFALRHRGKISIGAELEIYTSAPHWAKARLKGNV